MMASFTLLPPEIVGAVSVPPPNFGAYPLYEGFVFDLGLPGSPPPGTGNFEELCPSKDHPLFFS